MSFFVIVVFFAHVQNCNVGLRYVSKAPPGIASLKQKALPSGTQYTLKRGISEIITPPSGAYSTPLVPGTPPTGAFLRQKAQPSGTQCTHKTCISETKSPTSSYPRGAPPCYTNNYVLKPSSFVSYVINLDKHCSFDETYSYIMGSDILQALRAAIH